ncbi:class I adenylate-forming enzyme family protein [Actinokineospora inagensis]|uniref:class I adenylate-forming enzyme family protein n=1 Tax=Actinokineospora inagensis TaxID=103730 RepID=UPI000422659E|nr:long-chain fatty acid--CoA ligase [Actinokineospora inagensis]
MRILAHPFLARLADFGDRDAVVHHGERYGYPRLLDSLARWRHRFDEHGVRAGEVVALHAAHSPQACGALLALVERGAVVVPLTTVPPAKRAEFHEIAQVQTVVTVDGEPSVTGTGRAADHELYRRLRADGAPGLVLFSSGTSGRSKASVLDFHRVLDRYGPPKRPLRTLSFLNLDHIGGINTLLHTLGQGGALITVAERDPDTVFAAIAEHRVQVLPTTPTFLNMVLISGALDRHDTTSLELLTYGTEPMPPRTLRAVADALPDARLKQTYGLSELGILPTRSRGDGSLWVQLGAAGFEHKVVDGTLRIRSEMAMLGYLNAPAPFDADGFFDTQDAVETDGEWLRILGRRSEVINVGGEKVYPGEVEDVLLQVPGIAEATVAGAPNPVTGMVVRATVRLTRDEDPRQLTRRVREFCRGRLDGYKTPVVVEVADGPLHSDRMKKTRSAS